MQKREIQREQNKGVWKEIPGTYAVYYYSSATNSGNAGPSRGNS